MGKEITYICDRCGYRSSDEGSFYDFERVKWPKDGGWLKMSNTPVEEETERIMLCEDCSKDFDKWLKEDK